MISPFKNAPEVPDDVIKAHRKIHEYRLTGEMPKSNNDRQIRLLPEWAL